MNIARDWRGSLAIAILWPEEFILDGHGVGRFHGPASEMITPLVRSTTAINAVLGLSATARALIAVVVFSLAPDND